MKDSNVRETILELYSDTPKILFFHDYAQKSVDYTTLKNIYGIIINPITEDSLRLVLDNSVSLINDVIASEASKLKLKLATQTFELLNFNENIDDIISDTLFSRKIVHEL